MSVTRLVSNMDKSMSLILDADLNMRAMVVTDEVSHESKLGCPRKAVHPLNMSDMSCTAEVFQAPKSSTSKDVAPLKSPAKFVTNEVSHV